MNLLELMLKEEVTWPVGACVAVQDYDREMKFGSSGVPLMSGSEKVWIDGGFTKGLVLNALADDWQTRIITREEYKAAGGVIADDGFEQFVSVEDAHEYKAEHSITPSKYTKQIHGVSVDVYDVLMAWGVTNPALQHLVKKALQCGRRGHKDKQQDLQDIIDSAIRAKELEQDA